MGPRTSRVVGASSISGADGSSPQVSHSEAQLAFDELAAQGITAEDLAALRAARRSYRP